MSYHVVKPQRVIDLLHMFSDHPMDVDDGKISVVTPNDDDSYDTNPKIHVESIVNQWRKTAREKSKARASAATRGVSS